MSRAIYILATGEDEIRRRLFYATTQLHVLNRSETLPKPLWNEWEKIWNQLTKFGIDYCISGEERMGSIEHTMKRIKKKTARAIAENIYHLFVELRNY
ncbi:MAG TPA: hypothetical protein VJL87_05535 [Bdellovibrionota bacterium]|nr:hypothetical protein [Bdellovibrionota bacterium]